MNDSSGKKVKVPLPGGQTAEGVEVQAVKSNEPWSEFTLDDGTTVKIKTILVSAVRLDGQYDAEGNPVYILKTTPAISISDVPTQLRNKKG